MVNEFQQKYKVIQGERISFVINDAENLISIYKNKKNKEKQKNSTHAYADLIPSGSYTCALNQT